MESPEKIDGSSSVIVGSASISSLGGEGRARFGSGADPGSARFLPLPPNRGFGSISSLIDTGGSVGNLVARGFSSAIG